MTEKLWTGKQSINTDKWSCGKAFNFFFRISAAGQLKVICSLNSLDVSVGSIVTGRIFPPVSFFTFPGGH